MDPGQNEITLRMSGVNGKLAGFETNKATQESIQQIADSHY
jgi:hypothetical protein